MTLQSDSNCLGESWELSPVVTAEDWMLQIEIQLSNDPHQMLAIFFFSYACHEPQLDSQETASSSAECSSDKPLFSFVRGHDSTMWDIVRVLPQGHKSVSKSRYFLLQAPQCPCSMQKRFSRDHCCRGRSKPGCRIVGLHIEWELTT